MGQGKLRDLLAEPSTPGLLRGEVWINPEVWTRVGFPPGPKGRAAFVRSMGAELCFFPWPAEGHDEASVLADAAYGQGLDCALVIDGPFQRLAGRRDTCTLLGELVGTPGRFVSRLDQEKERLRALLDGLEGTPIDLILIGEDVGYTGGLYFAPEVFHTHLLPFYRELLEDFRAKGLAWGWHSDGKVEPLLADLVDCGFQCFSLEPEVVDLLAFKKRHPGQVSLLGGIRAAWLAAESFDRNLEETALTEIRALTQEGGLIMASTCGLHHPTFLPNLRRLYQLISPLCLDKAGF